VTLSMARDLPVMVEYRISDMGHLRSVPAIMPLSVSKGLVLCEHFAVVRHG
jgi:hypothetical protein